MGTYGGHLIGRDFLTEEQKEQYKPEQTGAIIGGGAVATFILASSGGGGPRGGKRIPKNSRRVSFPDHLLP